jgi:hypothetical protein
MRFVRMACAFVAFAAVATACGSPECGGNSPCPNDPPRMIAQGNACTALVSAYSGELCKDEWSALVNCNVDNTVCGADGKTDSLQTMSHQAVNCSAQTSSYQSCCAGEPGSGFCSTSTQ